MSRARLRTALAAAALLVAAREAGAADEQSRSDLVWNYDLTIKARWAWKSADDALKKQGVRQVADRALETLADGKTDAEGRGARMMLSVTEAPKDLAPGHEDDVRAWQILEEKGDAVQKQVDAMGDAQDDASNARRNEVMLQLDGIDKQQEDLEKKILANLSALWEKEEIRRLLMVRFGTDPKKWPETDEPTLEVLGKAAERDPGVPALCVSVRGEAGNLKAVPMNCKARMCLLVVREQMHRLAMWSWPTPRDREGLWSDLGWIEASYVIPKNIAKESRPGAADAGAATPTPTSGDADEEKKVGNLLVEGWEVLKPKGVKTVEIDRTKPDEPAGRWTLESGQDTASITLEVMRSDSRDAKGNAVGEPDLRGRLVLTWTQFLSSHTEGPLEVFEFARPSEKAPYLSLPPREDRKEMKRPPPGLKKDWDWAELVRTGIASEADNVRVTKEKVRNTYRMALKGVLPHTGQDVRLYYTFTLGVRTYVLTVVCYRDSFQKFDAQIDAFLRSFHLVSPER